MGNEPMNVIGNTKGPSLLLVDTNLLYLFNFEIKLQITKPTKEPLYRSVHSVQIDIPRK